MCIEKKGLAPPLGTAAANSDGSKLSIPHSPRLSQGRAETRSTLAKRNKPNLDALLQGRRDLVQHRDRVPFIIGVFQAADDRSRGADQLGQRALRQTGLGAEIVNLSRHGIIRPDLLQLSHALGLSRAKTPVEDYHRVARFIFCHFKRPLLYNTTFAFLRTNDKK